MALVGIDLGTTNSLISHFTEDGPVLIPNALGSFLTPSVVGFSDDKEVIVGKAARHRLISHPKLTHARFKRSMGTDRKFELGRKKFRAEELSAFVLKALKADAESHLGETVDRAIISVPAYFNDVQRKATYAAGKLAGLKVERLINEPTAAALAYGLASKEDENTFLVVDLGGGTFDVSILEIFDQVMEVRSSAGDAFLGGEDFTELVGRDFKEQLEKAGEKLDDKKSALLYQLANKAKEALSQETEISARFQGKSDEHVLKIDRERFETITKSLQEKLRRPIQRAIADAGMRSTDIDRIVLVGGATRMPVIRRMITKLLKAFPEHSLDPDHVVGLGAAVQCGLLDRHEALDEVVMTDVCPFTLGTEVAHQTGTSTFEPGYFQPIIERNTVVPVSRVIRNQTIRLGQKQIELKIYQGESPRIQDNIFLGELNLKVPENKKQHEEFDIRFTYDVSGVLEVLVTVVSNDQTERLILEGNPGSLSAREIEERLKSLEALKIHPKDKAENAQIVARLKANYENQLGPVRDHIQYLLRQFDQVLENQNDTDIDLLRGEISAWLEDLESQDIF